MQNTELRLPMQAAPIDRTPSSAALRADGMEPSAWYDDLLKAGTQILTNPSTWSTIGSWF